MATTRPIMCAYKVVRADFKYFGLQVRLGASTVCASPRITSPYSSPAGSIFNSRFIVAALEGRRS